MGDIWEVSLSEKKNSWTSLTKYESGADLQYSQVVQQTWLAFEYYSENVWMQIQNQVSFNWLSKACPKLERLFFADSILNLHLGVASDVESERRALRQTQVSIRLLIMFGNPSRRARPHIIAPLERREGWGVESETIRASYQQITSYPGK